MTDRYVCIMPEHGGTCCWEERGVGFSVEDLPISPQLSAELEAWGDAFSEVVEERDDEARENGGDPIAPWPRLQAYCERGLDLARRVKAELPDWRVFYWDEAKFEAALRALREENGGELEGALDYLIPSARTAFQFEVTL